MTTKKTKGRPSTKGQPSNGAKPQPSSKRTKKTTPKRTPRQLMLTDLKRSGLTDGDAKKFKYKPLTAEEVKELTGNYATGYLIPYHDINGKRVKDFWRVRYLEEVKGAFGASLKKPRRYTGPKNALPRFYFPVGVDWQALAKDADEPLMITEGEKKSEKACKMQLPCLSVPGVWAWRSKKQGIAAIPDFNGIKWKGRKVYLCFDNDLMTNPEVIAALNALAHELLGRGANVWIKYLPKATYKIGLDDYLVKRSAEAFLKLKEEEFKESAELWKLNERLAFVTSLAATYDFVAKRFYKSKAELLYALSDATYLIEKPDKSGFKEKNAAEDWLKWKQKRKYFGLCYSPGDEAVVEDNVNLWVGWGCEPKKGSIKEYRELMKFLFDTDPVLASWAEQWLAYPLQNPGKKNLTSLLIHSEAQGVGKSFLGYIMSDIYGKNFVVIDREAMRGNFNGWAVNKQFILGEEITGNNSREFTDRFKNMVTREQIHVNIKYQPQYDIEDCSNYFLTSNHDDALFIEQTDRRAVVHNVESEPREFEFYKRIDIWRKNDGAAHLFYYLLHDVDLSDYDPKKPAPMSKAKLEMIALSKSDLDLAIEQMRDNPDSILRGHNIVLTNPLLTTKQIAAFVNDYTGGNSTLIAVSKALRRAKFRQEKIDTLDGTQKVWAVRDSDKLVRLDRSEWVAIYNKHRPPTKKF